MVELELPPELFNGLAPLMADFVEQHLVLFQKAMSELSDG